MNDFDYALSLCNAGQPRPCPHPGALLRKLLKSRGLFTSDLMERSGISRTTIDSIVNEQQGITNEMCGKLAYALDLPVEFFFLAQQRYRYSCYLDGLRARLAGAQAGRKAA